MNDNGWNIKPLYSKPEPQPTPWAAVIFTWLALAPLVVMFPWVFVFLMLFGPAALKEIRRAARA
jgi:hypothetical protein